MRTCGYVSTYKHGCRCDDCRNAERLHRRRNRQRGRALTVICPVCGEWFGSEVGRGSHEGRMHR